MLHKPSILCLSGLDPTGGAGIQADIETLFSLGCHCLPVITSLTVQNTENVLSTSPVSPDLLAMQLNTLVSDMRIDAVKIGLIDSLEALAQIAAFVENLKQTCPDLPVVADPVLKAGGGFDFSTETLIREYRLRIIPWCTVITPNTHELLLLCPETESLDDAARILCDTNCHHVLLTGTHADTPEVVNRLYSRGRIADIPEIHSRVLSWAWPRLPGSYHGSGCTLASALAGGLANGLGVTEAAVAAQEFTWQSLQHAHQPGVGQLLPNRKFRPASLE
jgi:hydroxymethylpyrimidine/phosphomethylpyrimidine kinase